jgi:hypothetical protein
MSSIVYISARCAMKKSEHRALQLIERIRDKEYDVIDLKEVTNYRETKKSIKKILEEYTHFNVILEGNFLKMGTIKKLFCKHPAAIEVRPSTQTLEMEQADKKRKIVVRRWKRLARRALLFEKLKEKFYLDCLKSSTRHDFDWNIYAERRAKAAMWSYR